MADLIIGVKRMHSVEGSEIDEDDAPLQSPKTPGDREEAERLLRESSFSFSPPGSEEYSPPALDAPEPQSGQLPQPRPLRPMRLGGGHVEYARPAEGEAHADAAALEGDDEYSRLRAAASVFVELQEEEEHSFKSLLEKEVL
jgi:hypothetical protein